MLQGAEWAGGPTVWLSPFPLDCRGLLLDLAATSLVVLGGRGGAWYVPTGCGEDPPPGLILVAGPGSGGLGGGGGGSTLLRIYYLVSV